MSLVALACAKKAHVGDPLAKLVLLLLADLHNEHTGDCDPSISELVSESEMSRRTVFRKLDDLAAAHLIRIEPRTQENRRTQTNNYRLLFLPDEPAPAPGEGRARRSGQRRLPPHDWQPSAGDIEVIRKEFPHHETDRHIAAVTTEWIDFCHAKGVGYVNFSSAWRNSARRFFSRRNPKAADFAHAPRKRQVSGGVSATVTRLLAGEA